jgi:hypothetical protein
MLEKKNEKETHVNKKIARETTILASPKGHMKK